MYLRGTWGSLSLRLRTDAVGRNFGKEILISIVFDLGVSDGCGVGWVGSAAGRDNRGTAARTGGVAGRSGIRVERLAGCCLCLGLVSGHIVQS